MLSHDLSFANEAGSKNPNQRLENEGEPKQRISGMGQKQQVVSTDEDVFVFVKVKEFDNGWQIRY